MGSCSVTQGAQTSALCQPRGVGWGGREMGGKWEGNGSEGQEGGDICIPMAETCWCMVETNTIL